MECRRATLHQRPREAAYSSQTRCFRAQRASARDQPEQQFHRSRRPPRGRNRSTEGVLESAFKPLPAPDNGSVARAQTLSRPTEGRRYRGHRALTEFARPAPKFSAIPGQALNRVQPFVNPWDCAEEECNFRQAGESQLLAHRSQQRDFIYKFRTDSTKHFPKTRNMLERIVWWLRKPTNSPTEGVSMKRFCLCTIFAFLFAAPALAQTITAMGGYCDTVSDPGQAFVLELLGQSGLPTSDQCTYGPGSPNVSVLLGSSGKTEWYP